MSNNYYNFTGGPFIPGTKARSDQVNTEYQALVSAFDKLPSDTSATVRGVTAFAGDTAGSGNIYTVSMPDTRSSYQDGDEVTFVANRTCTAAASLNVDSLGDRTIVRADGTATDAGDIESGLIYTARYDDTNSRFQLMSPNTSYLTDAEASATAAAVSEINAAASESAAATSESNAADSATEAYHWAQYAEDSLVPEGDLSTEYSAYHWAQKAAEYAAGVNLPAIAGGDALKILRVNAGETAYELYNIYTSAAFFQDDFVWYRSNPGVVWYNTANTDKNWTFATDGAGDFHAVSLDDSFIPQGTKFTLKDGCAALIVDTADITFNSSSLIVPSATSSVEGKIEIATQTEVNTGTDTSRAVTPATLAGYTGVGGRLIDRQVFTSSGNWTKPSGMSYAVITVVGGGGGSAGATAAGTTVRVGGSGAGGGASVGILTDANLSSSETVTIGAAGSAGAAANGSGGNGGSSLFGTFPGSNYILANGGGGGSGSISSDTPGNPGSGGGYTNGSNVTAIVGTSGEDGNVGNCFLEAGGSKAGISGKGGSAGLGVGHGGHPVLDISGTTAGSSPSGYGSGASAAVSSRTTSGSAGAAGSQGIVIVESYS